MTENVETVEKRFVAYIDALRDNENSIPDDNGVVRTTKRVNKIIPEVLRKAMVQFSFATGRRELSDELADWIRASDASNEINTYITEIIKTKKYSQSGSKNLCLAMVYQILCDNGFYLLGKNKKPILITIDKYCKMFEINRRQFYRPPYNGDFSTYTKCISPQTQKLGSIFEKLQQTVLSKFG